MNKDEEFGAYELARVLRQHGQTVSAEDCANMLWCRGAPLPRSARTGVNICELSPEWLW